MGNEPCNGGIKGAAPSCTSTSARHLRAAPLVVPACDAPRPGAPSGRAMRVESMSARWEGVARPARVPCALGLEVGKGGARDLPIAVPALVSINSVGNVTSQPWTEINNDE